MLKGNRQPMRRIIGTYTVTNCDGQSTTTVPRCAAAFIGRFHKDTTVDMVTSVMEAGSMTDVKCFKLETKDGRTFGTAAFYVSRPMSQKDKLYNEQVWPIGSDVPVREWYFKKSHTDFNGNNQKRVFKEFHCQRLSSG